MTRSLKEYLQDIQKAVNTIERLVGGISFEQLAEDEKTILAVMMSFVIIGEATKAVPQSFRDKHPQVPWRDMAGMRDNMVHEYFQVDLKVVWETARDDLPELKLMISEIIPKFWITLNRNSSAGIAHQSIIGQGNALPLHTKLSWIKPKARDRQ